MIYAERDPELSQADRDIIYGPQTIDSPYAPTGMRRDTLETPLVDYGHGIKSTGMEYSPMPTAPDRRLTSRGETIWEQQTPPTKSPYVQLQEMMPQGGYSSQVDYMKDAIGVFNKELVSRGIDPNSIQGRELLKSQMPQIRADSIDFVKQPTKHDVKEVTAGTLVVDQFGNTKWVKPPEKPTKEPYPLAPTAPIAKPSVAPVAPVAEKTEVKMPTVNEVFARISELNAMTPKTKGEKDKIAKELASLSNIIKIAERKEKVLQSRQMSGNQRVKLVSDANAFGIPTDQYNLNNPEHQQKLAEEVGKMKGTLASTTGVVGKEIRDLMDSKSAFDVLRERYQDLVAKEKTGLLSGSFETLLAKLGRGEINDPHIKAYLDEAKAMVATIKGITKDTGVMTEQDMERIRLLIADIKDDSQVSMIKFADIDDLIGRKITTRTKMFPVKQRGIGETGGGRIRVKTPDGTTGSIDASEWPVREKEGWKKL